MYRTPTHEPLYKQETHDRDSKDKSRRYEEPRESSEGSTSDEEEESTDRYTEESEDTAESQCRQGECEWNAAGSGFNRDRLFTGGNRPEDFLMRAYYANHKVQTRDKITQKNFLSPFPSFLIPPICRNVAGPPNFRFTGVRNSSEDQGFVINSAKVKSAPNKLENFREERIGSRDRRDQHNLCGKHRAQRGLQYLSRNYKPERVLMCVKNENAADRPTVSKNVYSRSAGRAEGGKKSKSSFREDNQNHQPITCKDCLEMMENRKRGRRSVVGGAEQTEKAMRGPLWGKRGADVAPGSSVPGKVKEKLVYVVEEEGKDVTKLETDLFSVNEILTIKKDLLELSEFAKKLKKLKEMKRNAEKGKASESGCQCKPVAELLKDVNKRIEALEARQEELEKGSQKTSQKGGTEIVSKKASEPKTSIDSPSKMPAVRKQSAMTRVPSFPKTEMIVSREGFSNNSEIVNELMDIKTQLQKLEKKRMTKEMAPEAAPLGESKVTKKKDHAIAVFSSRTYILTAENFKKKKKQLSIQEEGNARGCFSVGKNLRSRTEQTKENVVNWLRNVSPVGERSQNEIPMFVEAEEPMRNNGQARYCTWSHDTKGEGYVNQEPPKNRASEVKSARQGPNNSYIITKNEKGKLMEPVPHLSCKECIMTPSGRLFIRRVCDEFPKEMAIDRRATKVLVPHERLIRRSSSSCSMPSAILAKEHVARMKTHAVKEIFREASRLMASHSNSVQELSMSSSRCKDEKTVRNMNVKNLASRPTKDKVHKENKNEYVKRLDTNLTVLKNCRRGSEMLNSSSTSELIRTINLDTDVPSDLTGRQEDFRSNMQVYSLGTMTNLNFKDFGGKVKDECFARERRRIEAQCQKPGPSARNDPLPCQPTNPPERPRIQNPDRSAVRETTEEEPCKCMCCCKKREPKKEEQEPCVPRERRECVERRSPRERRRCRSSSERTNEKLARKRERKERKMRKYREKREERKRKREAEREKRRECKERAKRRKSKDCQKKSRSCDRVRQRRRSRECSRPKRRSRTRCSRSHHKCQGRRAPSFCHSGCLPSTSCCRMVQEESSEQIQRDKSNYTVSKSRDSLEAYQRYSPRTQKAKATDDSCLFRNIYKNLRKMYPKFSFSSADFHNAKPSAQHRKRREKISEDDTEDGEEEDEDDDDGNYFYGRLSPHMSNHGSRCRYRHQSHRRQQQHSSHCHHLTARPQHLKSCKCIRVFLQTQDGQKWPGVQPLRSPSRENAEDVSSSKSSGKSNVIKRDFIFPGKLPQSHCIGHSCERKRGRRCEESRGRRHQRDDRRRRRKRHGRKHEGEECLCMCERCGNVHEKDIAKKERVKLVEKGEKPQCADATVPVEQSCEKPSSQLHFPMISFLKHFCRTKPRTSIFELKTCAKIARKKEKQSPSCCQCRPKLTEIECRLNNLEQKQPDDRRSKRRRRRRRVRNEDDCDSGRRSRKKKKRRRKKCCYCPENVVHVERMEKAKGKRKGEQNEIETCYCTCPVSNKTIGMVDTSESLATKTTTTTTATATATATTTATTTSTTEESKSSTDLRNKSCHKKKDWGLKQKLSSFQGLMNNFQERCKKSKRRCDANSVFVVEQVNLIDDCSKSSPMPRSRVGREASGLLKKIKKLKCKGKEMKKGDEKEKEGATREESPRGTSRGRKK